ncbi:MAG: LCP family protein [Chloroflexi bacterium]|nr:LCP family protein [Chloroflexota bacterium]
MPDHFPLPSNYWEDTQPNRAARVPEGATQPNRPPEGDTQPLRPIRRPRPRRYRPTLLWLAFGVSGPLIAALGGIVAFLLFVPPPRANVLILGLDRRPNETGPSRSDTMILATVNPKGQYVGMLSIPRDLWVTIPGHGENRINTAHFFAEASQRGAGPAAAMQTVSANFGVPVDYYVRLDFVGFVRIVDSVGGIEVEVPAPLIDYEYPTYDYGTTVVEFNAGPQHMGGERALAYARIRHGSSDFKRAERQGLVMQAFFNRLLQPSAWPYLPKLALAVRASIDTDLDPIALLRLAPTILRVGPGGVDRRVIEGDMVRPFTTSGGAAVQAPVWENINPVLLDMFGE